MRGFRTEYFRSHGIDVPLVVYDNRGHKSIIEIGVNGYVVPN